MASSAAAALLDFVSLDPAGGTPLYHQIYSELRSGILNGRLAANTRLPSTRAVAAALVVSRRPVREAYGFLLAEGLLVTRQGAGTYVRDRPVPRRNPHGDGAAGSPQTPTLSRRGTALVTTSGYETRWTGAFAPTLPASDQFPRGVFARLLARRWRNADDADFRKPPAAGLPVLREAVAGYLRATRGLDCSGDRVVITAGSTHAVGLLARLLLNPGDRAWTENPGWPTGRQTLAANEVVSVPVPVDRHGLDVEAGRMTAPDARLALVSPTRQYPLGMGMPLGRRLELLTWAQDQHAWIVEDDYDGEFQYAARILPPLQTLDPHGRVIYMGSFSKVLTQALRVGYLVLPQSLVEPVSRALSHDKVVPTLAQAAIAEFLHTGEFARHVRRMRAIYRIRQDALVAALSAFPGPGIRAVPADSGFHVLAVLPGGSDEAAVSRGCAERGVYAPALDDYFHPGTRRPGGPDGDPTLVLGFAGVDGAELDRGIAALREALADLGFAATA